MEKLLNLEVYTPLDLSLFGVCCIFWFLVYIIVIINIIKHKVVEIPVAAVVANFSWELLWSWCFHTNLGELFQWGYRIWFFMDIFIIYSIFRYGHKQFQLEPFKKQSVVITAFGLAFWMIGLYFLIPEHDTDGFGAFSAYLINIYMSAFYCYQIIRQPEFGISNANGWFKMIGTAGCSAMIYNHFWNIPGYKGLMALCAITLFLDLWYIYLQYSRVGERGREGKVKFVPA